MFLSFQCHEGCSESNFSELLTNQAMRKKIVLCRKNVYIRKLLLIVVTAGIEALVLSGNKFLYACIEEVCDMEAQPHFDTFHHIITVEVL
jgi:hypothetical protein